MLVLRPSSSSQWGIFCQFFLIILCHLLVVVEGRIVNPNGTVNLNNLNQAEDDLLRRFFGDFDLTQEGLWESRFGEHVGHDNVEHFTNEWLVHVPKGQEQANQIANESGYFNLGQVKGFDKVFRFVKVDHPEQHHREARELTHQLASDGRIIWADQQFAKSRTKRDFNLFDFIDKLRLPNILEGMNPESKEKDNQVIHFNDPLWHNEWYMQDTRTRASLPRLDLNVVPVFQMGITGKGVKVTVLDDGLEHTHKDLRDNYNPSISGDLNDNDNDPMPRYGAKPPNSHGTRCAGEIAMKANNNMCGVGVAYNAQIGGIRMLDGPVSDRIEGEALSYASNLVDVYSASWGPSDDGETVEGPGRLAQRAFLQGVTQGRQGKGIIYVWASGNGGAKGDCCSCDGYASNIYTLSIGSASESGTFPWYGEKCPSTMAVTYSSGAYTDQKIATTDIHDTCTTGHTGTSASAPLAAGIVALALEANPNLSWRDVKHLVAWTSQPGPLLDNPGWLTNGAGFQFNPRFGFGLMDAHDMVLNALNWTSVPAQRICRASAQPLSDQTINGKSGKLARFITSGCRGMENEINYLEHVEVLTSVDYNLRGSLQIDLTSPQGTTTRLLFPRKSDKSAVGFTKWPFVSVHSWGENPAGTWTVRFSDSEKDENHKGFLHGIELIFYGTRTQPAYMKNGPRVYPKIYKKSIRGVDDEGSEKNTALNRIRAILNDFDEQEWA